jgi:hypothetical protein
MFFCRKVVVIQDNAFGICFGTQRKVNSCGERTEARARLMFSESKLLSMPTQDHIKLLGEAKLAEFHSWDVLQEGCRELALSASLNGRWNQVATSAT